MSILITTPTQLDNLILDCEEFILKKVVTNIPDYEKEAKVNLTTFSYRLSNVAFRSQPVEGFLMLFKKRHGIILPPKSDFFIVEEDVTPQEALQAWGDLQSQPIDKDPVRFVTDHLAYYFNFNNMLFYQLTNSSLSLVNIVVE